jgi:hypothetical protein
VENFYCFWCETCLITCWVSNLKFFEGGSFHNTPYFFVQDCVVLFNLCVTSVFCELLFSCIYLYDMRAISLLVNRLNISQASPMRVIIVKVDLCKQNFWWTFIQRVFSISYQTSWFKHF